MTNTTQNAWATFQRWFVGCLLLVAGFCTNSAFGQSTLLIDPAGDGGFNNGTTFAANGWSVSNSANNPWVVGTAITTAPFAGNSAYISNTNGATHAYSNTSTCVNYFWRDVTIPAGQPYLLYSFNWFTNTTDVGWDLIQVVTAPTTVIPTGTTTYPGSGSTTNTGLSGGTVLGGLESQSTPQTASGVIVGTAGQTVRLIFVWKNDGSFGNNPPGAIDNISVTATATLPTYTATTTGGLWSSPATWVGGIVPPASTNAVIPAGSVVTMDQAVSVANLTVNGTFQWNATNSALTALENVTIGSTGRFLAYSSSLSSPTINVGGNFTNNGYANLALVGNLNFNGLGSTLGGSGTFEGDGTRGFIRLLTFANVGNNVINTNQSLVVTTSMNHTAGSLNTNGKLSIDNTATLFGRPINTQVASAVVTGMGSGYTATPYLSSTTATLWTASAVTVGAVRVNPTTGVQYVCVAAGTSTAAPSGAVGTFETDPVNTGLTWVAVGNAGDVGTALFAGSTILTPAVGTVYHYNGKLFLCTANPAMTVANITSSLGSFSSATTGTVVTVGTTNFRCIGTVCNLSANYDAATGTVRSITVNSAGSGYTAAPAFAIVANQATAPTAATATLVYIQSFGGATYLPVQKSGQATVTGGLTINSDQGVSSNAAAAGIAQASSGVGAVFCTSGGSNYTVAPQIGFSGPTALNLVVDSGSNYTSAPTITVTGGTQPAGQTALVSSDFTITVNQGRIVSVYLNAAVTKTYITPPTLTFTGGGGSGATLAFPNGCWPAATPNIGENGQITSITVTNSGFGYVVPPTVNVGNASATTTGGTYTTAASGFTARVAAYYLVTSFFTPATGPGTQLDNAFIPASRKMHALWLNGNDNGAQLTGNLTLMSGGTGTGVSTTTSPVPLRLVASTSTTASLGQTGNILDLGGNNLYFSWNGFAGATSSFATGSIAFVRNGSITLTTRGGGTTGSTLIFPFAGTATGGTFRVFTGTGTAVTNGATAAVIRVTEMGTATGNLSTNGQLVGGRTYRVTTLNPGGRFGTNPTVTMNFNTLRDTFNQTLSNQNLFIAQSIAFNGPTWDVRSFAATSGTLATAGTRTTATTTPGPIVSTGDDYFAWASDILNCNGTPSVAAVTPSASSVCQGAPVSFTATNLPAAGTNGISYQWQRAATAGGTYTNIAGATTSSLTTTDLPAGDNYVVLLVSCSISGQSSLSNEVLVTVNGATITASTPTFCGTGGSTTLTAVPSSAVNSITWTPVTSTATVTGTGTNVNVTVTETSEFQAAISFASGSTCNVLTSVGVYPLPSATVTTTANGVCPGTQATINSGLSAGNFTVSSIPYRPFTVPSNANTIVANGVANTAAGWSSTANNSLDDGGWAGIPIGFNFNYFGSSFNTIAAGTNGTLMFGPVSCFTTATGCLGQFSFNTTGGVFPNANNPGNVIALMAGDQWFGGGTGKIRYWTEGAAPNRRFVILYDSVNRCCSGTNASFTAYAILYETTGIVDIHVRYNNQSGSSNTIGLQNAARTIGATAPGRQNFITAITTSEGWRFSPPSNYTTTWYANGVATTGQNIFSQNVSPSVTTQYVISYTNQTTGCSNDTSTAKVTMAVLGTTAPTGVTTNAPASVCSSTSSAPSTINLSTSYTGITDGFTFQWQVSTNNGGTWNNITGATNITATTSQTVASQYRLQIVSCGGTPSFSTPASVTMNPGYACYCASGATTNADEDILNVTLGTLNNTSSCITTGGGNSVQSQYSNYTTLTAPKIGQGTTVNYSLQVGSCGNNNTSRTAIFIDFNQNGTYDASELVALTTAAVSPSTQTGTFLVPMSATVGLTGMRVMNIATTDATQFTGCNNTYATGETEDYVVEITAAPACSGTPSISTISSSVGSTASVGTAFTLSVDNPPAFSNITYAWSSSTNDGATFTPISNSNSTTISRTHANASDVITYQVTATCNGSGLSATSSNLTVSTQPNYCTANLYTTGKTAGDLISNVVIQGTTLANNTGTDPVNPWYTLFTGQPNYTATLAPATTYSLVVTIGSFTNQGIAAWIDYNDDGVFAATERIGFSNGTVTPGFGTATFPITLSCTPPAGVHRLRVRGVYATNGNVIDPCTSYTWGETEDYNITITPAPACIPGGLVTAGTPTAFTVPLSWAQNCASATNWDIQYGPSGFTLGNGTTVSGVTPTLTAGTYAFTVTGLNSSTAYDFYVRANCGTGNTSTWSFVASATTLQAPCSGTPTAGTISVAPGTVACNAVAFTINATGFTADGGMTYQWQSSTDNGATWVNIAGATTPGSVSVSQTQATQYRLTDSCANSNQVGVSNVLTFAMAPASQCYCTPVYTSGKVAGDLISNVIIQGTTLSNNSGTDPVNPAYTYFVGQPNYTATLAPATTYNLVVSIGSFVNQGVAAWIDYNDDGVFATTERIGFTNGQITTAFGTGTFPITLSCTPPAGVHRLRVRGVYATNGNLIDPCASYTWGETEDYDVTITPAPACIPGGVVTAGTATSNTVPLSWVQNCASATNWDVQYGPTGFTLGNGTTVSVTPTLSAGTYAATISGLLSSTAYDFYVRANCGSGNTSTWSPVASAITLQAQCAGTPNAGTIATTVGATVCANTNFTLTATGFTADLGMTYQWQRSTDNGNSWNNIVGANTAASVSVTQTVATQYRLNATCGNSSLSASSNVISVGMSTFNVCYCSSVANSTNGSDVFNVTVETLNNSSTCATTGGAGSILNRYSNYTGLTPVDLPKNTTISYSLQIGNCTGGSAANRTAIFIDFNQNGSYDTVSERIVLTTVAAGANTRTGTFTIPSGAINGVTGMRILNIEATASTAFVGCATYTNGETEDYLVNITNQPVCSGTPVLGNTISSVGNSVVTGGSFNLSVQNTLTASGITYQWQQSTNGGGSYTDISGATQTTYSTSLSGLNNTVWYRLAATCAGSGQTGFSTPTSVTTTYCVPTTSSGAGCTGGDVIARVVLNTLDNNSGTGCPGGTSGYSDYTGNSALTTTLQPATTYGITVYTGQYGQDFAAWIDYNDDGIFDNATERVGFTTSQVAGSNAAGVLGQSATFPITLSCNPPAGVHRLRIRCSDNVSGSSITPCGSVAYGETEDYNITIAAPPACAFGGTLTASNPTTSSVNLSWTQGCAPGNNWDIQYGPSGFALGSGTILTNVNATNSYVVSGLNSSTSYQFYIRANCGGGSTSAWSFVASATTQQVVCSGTPSAGNAATTFPANVCSGTTMTITAGGYSGDVGTTYQWERSTNGGASWSSISGATNPATVSVTPTAATQYRLAATCSNSGLTGYSNVISVGMSSFAYCYCASGATTTANTDITNVTVGSLNNSSSCFTTGAATQVTGGANSVLNRYSNYTHLSPITIMTNTSVGYSIQVATCGSSASYRTAIFIDYNRNGSYDTVTERVVLTPTANGGSTQTGTFFVPVSALSGVTGMRVVNIQATASTAFTGCASYTNGETEDYVVNIVAYPAANVTSFTPTSAAGGTTITIRGANFANATGVSIGGVAATSFSVVNDTTITAVVASGANSGGVTVTGVSGPGSLSGFTFIPAPTISSFSPTGTGAGNTVTITGTNFTGASAVSFGGVAAASFNVVSSTSITAVVGSGASGNVSVTTPGGSASLAGFTFVPAATISSFTPTSAGTGTTITITGTNFTGVSAVTFGGTPAASFSVVNATTITAVVGAGASGDVSIATVGGGGSLSGFTYIPTCSGMPTAASVSSTTTTPVCSGTSVTVNGDSYSTDLGMTFQWQRSTDNGNSWSNISGATNATSVTANNMVTTQYRLLSTCSNGGQSTPSNVVTIEQSFGPAMPAMPTVNIADRVCNGDTRIYTVASQADASSYVWTVPVGATITSGQGTTSITVSYDSSFAQSDTLRVAAVNGCGTSATIGLLVRRRFAPPTPPTLISQDGELRVCPGDTRNFSIPAVPNATTYVWSVTNGTINSGQGDTVANITFGSTIMQDSVVKVSVSAQNACGSRASRGYVVRRNREPRAPGGFDADPSSKRVCPGDSRTLSVNDVPRGDVYTWTIPGGTITSGQGTTQVLVTFNSSVLTDTTVTVTASNSCGLTGSARTFNMRRGAIPGTPGVISGSEGNMCNGRTNVQYSVAPQAAATGYTWSFSTPAGTVTSGQGTSSILASFAAGIDSTVLSVVGVNGCGTSTNARTLRIYGAPGRGVVVGPSTACPQSTVQFTMELWGVADSFRWRAPAGSTITSGGVTGTGTVVSTSPDATVTFGNNVGRVTCAPVNACGVGPRVGLTVAGCGMRGVETSDMLEVELVPNPANEQVSIRVNSSAEGVADVRLLTLTGQVVTTEQMPSVQHGQIVLPVNHLTPGVYMVEVTVNGQKITKQLVKQ